MSVENLHCEQIFVNNVQRDSGLFYISCCTYMAVIADARRIFWSASPNVSLTFHVF